jgi:GTP-binding protein Era
VSDANPDAGHRSGFAALVGRPNVGKSTLINALLGRKISIVTPKPQTTRHRILGILTRPEFQIVFVDTPGLHAGQARAMNRYLNRAAQTSLADADVLLLVVEALRFTAEDERVLETAARQDRPVLLLVNKTDRVKPKHRLLPYIDDLRARAAFVDIVPVSATRRDNVSLLPGLVAGYLPLSPPLFPADQITDRSREFQAAEIVREKLTWRLRDELPYGLAVGIERFETDETGRLLINAVIWVERTGQKVIVIGQGGEGLKTVGRAARMELARLFGTRVHLELWVKVKENWSDSEAALRQFGYES